MGRELRRVPLDFDAPLDKVWKGYVEPREAWVRYCRETGSTCFNGNTAAGQWLDKFCRLISLAGMEAACAEWERLHPSTHRIYPHPYLQDWELAPRVDVHPDLHREANAIEDEAERKRSVAALYAGRRPEVLPLTKELQGLVEALAGRTIGGAFDNAGWEIRKNLLAKFGLPEGFGICPVCKGSGEDPEQSQAHKEWEPYGPPTGEGWQLWETVSEGGPISPVFATPEGLIDFMSQPDPRGPGRSPWAQGYSRKAAENFVRGSGWAPSGMTIPGKGYMEGVTGMAELAREDPS